MNRDSRLIDDVGLDSVAFAVGMVAIEDKIADPIESVHLAIGEEIAPKKYLVAVVRHTRMVEWVEAAEVAGLGHAALVPDALALPVPGPGEWCAEAGDGRVVVRSGDATGFAAPAALIGPAWEAAGRPRIWNMGATPIGELPQQPYAGGGGGLAERLMRPALDLRQGIYARRASAARSSWLKRFGWIAAAGIAAHTVIAAADAVMLRVIAERRAEDVRTAVAQAAPGTPLNGDLEQTVVELLPAPGAAPGGFVPAVTQLSRALAPLSSAVTARAMRYEGSALVLEIEPGAGDLAGRVRAALQAAGVAGQVSAGADGAIRVSIAA